MSGDEAHWMYFKEEMDNVVVSQQCNRQGMHCRGKRSQTNANMFQLTPRQYYVSIATREDIHGCPRRHSAHVTWKWYDRFQKRIPDKEC